VWNRIPKPGVGSIPSLGLALALAGCLICGTPASSSASDLRSTELVRLVCSSTIGRIETTLFANGTVRRRTQGVSEVELGEMTTPDVDHFIGRLEAFDLRRVHTRYRRGVVGDWVDICELMLDLDGSGPVLPTYFSFGPFDALPAPLGSVLDVVRELESKVAPFSTERLPSDYVGRPGDILRAKDGSEYRIVGETGDRRGFEIQRLDQPMTIFIPREQMIGQFVEIIKRRGESVE